MSTAALAGTIVTYPSLQVIADLMRLFLNDWQKGALATPGEGKISSDNPLQSPQTLPALSSAVRELYRELRNAGHPRLLRDNVQANLPANGLTGPNVQTYLAFTGYFDGQTLQPSPVLPPDMLEPVRLWEQQTSTQLPFVPMRQPQFGLESRNQTFALGDWEWREGQLNFVGALCPITIRMRYYAALSQFFAPVTYISAISYASGVLTFTAANTLSAGQSLYLSGFAIATGLNGLTVSVTAATPTQFQIALPVGFTFTVTDQGIAQPVLNYSLLYVNTFVPIQDCEEVVAYKAAAKIAKALSGVVPATTDLDAKAAEAMFQLRNAIARRSQSVNYEREPYTGEHRKNDRNLM